MLALPESLRKDLSFASRDRDRDRDLGPGKAFTERDRKMHS